MMGLFQRLVGTGTQQVFRGVPSLSKVIPPQSINNTSSLTATGTVQQVRGKCFDHHFLNKWMCRDYKRTQLMRKHNQERLRYIAMKRCSVLPAELKEVAGQELQEGFPRDACFNRIHERCIMTGRGRWVLRDFRLSRIQWRLLADYNKLSGVQRATW